MGAFKDHAEDYNTIGLTPLPVQDKKPRIAGFNRWRGVSQKTIETFSNDFPEAELAILTRLSDVIIVDVDSKESDLVSRVIQEFGFTPIVVSTKRGFHLYYSNPDNIKGIIGNAYPVDMKGAGASDFVVVPPSNGYEFVSVGHDSAPCDDVPKDIYHFLEILKDGLPPMDKKGIEIFFPSRSKSDEQKPHVVKTPSSTSQISVKPAVSTNDNSAIINPYKEKKVIGEGTRNRNLWILGMRYSANLVERKGHGEESFHSLKQYLLKLNEEKCKPPLICDEAIKIAENIWCNYELKGKNYVGQFKKNVETLCFLFSPEAMVLSLAEPKAFALLLKLKSLHQPENKFCLNRKGLANKLRVSERLIRTASEYLRANGYVKQVSKSDSFNGIAARYVFTDKANLMIQRTTPATSCNDNSLDDISTA